MKINGNVYCFFEQSGTFKREFIKLGIPAEDYDIQNNFGETDHTVDLFQAIEDAYDGKPSLFDNITPDDLIMAFFPCIYFCESSQCAISLWYYNYRKLSDYEKVQKILARAEVREKYYKLLIKMVGVCLVRKIRLVIENPWKEPHYLKNNFLTNPTVIDGDRTRRGDYYQKPTAYWFWNCEPTHGLTIQQDKVVKKIRRSSSGAHAGICSEERSMISPDYARNFICDFILGKQQEIGQLSIFNASVPHAAPICG